MQFHNHKGDALRRFGKRHGAKLRKSLEGGNYFCMKNRFLVQFGSIFGLVRRSCPQLKSRDGFFGKQVFHRLLAFLAWQG